MAITSTPDIYYPSPMNSGSALGYSAITLNADGDMVGFVFDVPRSGTLDWFEFRTTTVTQSPVNGLDLSFQDVDPATDLPDGVRDQFRVLAHPIAASTWHTPTGPITSDGTDEGTKRTVVQGDRLACVIGFSTFAASDALQITNISGGGSTHQNAFIADAADGSYAKSGSGLVLALRYDDGTYVSIAPPMVYGPYSALTATQWNTGSTPDERGLRFQVPIACRVKGAWVAMAGSSTGDWEFNLYNNAGTTLVEKAVDGIFGNSPTIAVPKEIIFDESIELSANVTYRMTVRPTTVNNVTMTLATIPSGRLGAITTGDEWYSTSRSDDTGAFTDLATAYLFMGLILDGIDIPSGSGGNSGGTPVCFQE